MASGVGNETAGLPLEELRGRPGLKIAHLNVRSITSKINQLRVDLPNSNLDILTTSETWLNGNTEDRLASIPNYNLVRWDRQTQRQNGTVKAGGGLGIYYRDKLDIDPTTYEHLNVSDATIELQWVLVMRPHCKTIILGNVYRPPDGNFEQALGTISAALDQVQKLDKYEILIMGDFNADDSKRNKVGRQKLRLFEAEHQLIQMIKEPTRYSARSHTTIDLAFTNIKYCTGAGVLNYNISDHKLIYIIKKKPRNHVKTVTRIGRSYRGITHEIIKDKLATYNTENIINSADPNECCRLLEELIYKALDELCPLKEMRMRINSAEYLNTELLELQKDRDYFARKADTTGDIGDRFISGCLMKRARAENERARSNHYLNLAIQHEKQDKKLWRDIHGMEPKAQQHVANIRDEETGKLVQGCNLPEHVNDYFVGIGAGLAIKFKRIGHEQKKFIPEENSITFELKQVTQVQVLEKVNKAAKDKASGMKNMSATFLISAMTVLICEYTHLFNLTIAQGIFPDVWKVATVTPIPKIANPKTCGDLRPISILPLPGKLFEQLASEAIKEHLEGSGYLADQQNGFRKDRSTTKSLASLIDEIQWGTDNGEFVVTVFLDFKKAFDTVDHDTLIWKLGKAGVGENTCGLMRNYLTGRKQMTKLDGVTSELKPISTGVPQGSTLGPLLFIVFLNDLPQITKLAMFTLFADDATITVRNKCLIAARDTLNTVLGLIHTYCNENMLTLNTKKTEYVVFGTKSNKTGGGRMELRLGEGVLREVESYKYLGTTLDSTMTATKQLGRLNQQLALKLTTFRKIRGYMSENTAIMIYKATILPIFDYNDIIYGLLTQQQQTKLQRIQNKALRMVFRGKTLSVHDMHDRAGLDLLETRRENHLLALMYSRTKDPNYLAPRTRDTRRADAIVLKTPHPKTNRLKKAPIYKGSTMWNSLPSKIRCSGSKLELKNLMRRHRAGLPLDWREGPNLITVN